MFRHGRSTGLLLARLLLTSLLLTSVAALQLMPEAAAQDRAQDRMSLGVPVGATGHFQSDVGDRVFFSDQSAALGTRARTALEAQAAWLLRNPDLRVTIEGHADEAGDDQANLDISQRRALAVRAQLVARGVPAARVEVVA